MAVLQSTSFTMDLHSSNVVATTTGTCPGMPMADLLFQEVFTRCLAELEEFMRQDGSGVTAPDCPIRLGSLGIDNTR